VDAIDRVASIDRVRCREVFEKRFSVSRMVQDYLKLYAGRSEVAVQP